MKRLAIATGLFVAITTLAAPAMAAPDPSGTGQPGVECGDSGATSLAPGFDAGGFATAEDQYAGSDGTNSLNSGNDHAVSQYDVACYQITQAGG
jgi:hypothetical protein